MDDGPTVGIDGSAGKLDALIDVDRQLGEVLVASVDRGKSNHRAIRLLMVSLVAELVLLLCVAAMAVDNRRTAAKVDDASTALVLNCKAGNESRALLRQLWVFVLSQQTPVSAEQRASIDRFRGFVDSTFADRDCSHLNR